VPIQVTNGINFDNFTYSCADTALYGLIRQNYFSYEKNPFDPLDSIQVLDSTSIKLGRIDPKTGIVTTISPGSLMQGGYTLNGGSAIDPNAMTYYFNRGNAIVGVSLITGELVSNKVLSFEDGQYFDLMRNFENCISASAFRARKGSTGIARNLKDATIEIFPNPNQGIFSIQSSFSIKHVSIHSIAGEQIFQQGFGSNQIDIDMSSFNEGVYIINLSDENGQTISRKLVKY
jgi:lipopolysaccharide biosynthesis glycosyltransferase